MAQKKWKRLIEPLLFFNLSANLDRLFLHAGVLLYCLRGNRSRGLCAVSRLRIGRSRADRAPCLTTRQTYAHANSDYQ